MSSKLIALVTLAVILVQNVECIPAAKELRGNLVVAESSQSKFSEKISSSSSVSSSKLGACKDFSVFAATALNFDGAVNIVYTGNIGSIGSIQGLYSLRKGSKENGTPSAQQCADDQIDAFTFFENKDCPAANKLETEDLAGVTLFPGVYCSATGTLRISAASLTLDAKGVSTAEFIFQTDTTVETATATSVKLINGAQASNVYWNVGTALTLGTSSSFAGNIMTKTSITLDKSAQVEGRLLAQAAVTFEGSGEVSLKEIPSSSGATAERLMYTQTVICLFIVVQQLWMKNMQ